MLPVELEKLWNAQADEFNQWSTLGLDEKLEFSAKAEREACARVAEDLPECSRFTDEMTLAAIACAEAIRKRSNVQKD